MEYSKTLAQNRKARHNYFFEKDYECGIVLSGTEVKSIKNGAFNFKDSYAAFNSKNELFLINFQITKYHNGGYTNHNPIQNRKLLLNKRELKKLHSYAEQKGYSLIPLSLYIKGSLIKLKLGVGRGKKLYDKSESIKDRDMQRNIEREVKKYK